MRSDVLLFPEFINIVFVFKLYLSWIHYIFIYFFSDLFCWIPKIYDFPDSKFLNVSANFTPARATGNLWSIIIKNEKYHH